MSKSKKVYDVVLYKDTKKEWRWRVKAHNGNVIGASTEGYKNKKDMVSNIETLSRSLENFVSGDEKPSDEEE